MDDRDLSEEAPGVGRTYGPWVLFGMFGLGVAVGIALLAGSFASQPVGLTGNPVSAGSALKPAIVEKAPRNRAAGREGRRKKADGAAAETASSTTDSAAGPKAVAPSSGSGGATGTSAGAGASSGSGGPSDSRGSSGAGSSSDGGSRSGGDDSGGSDDYDDGDDSDDDFEYEDDDD